MSIFLPYAFHRQLILSSIPKESSAYSIEVPDNVVKSFSSRQLEHLIVAHNHVEEVLKLPRTGESVQHCKGKICCEFTVQYHEKNDRNDIENRLRFSYKLTIVSSSSQQIAAGSGSKDFICAIVACTSDKRQSCGKRSTGEMNDVVSSSLKFTDIRVRMIVELETSEHDYLIMPTNLNTALLPLDVRYFKFTRSSTFTVNRWVNVHIIWTHHMLIRYN